jgi:hypothetical protein
VSGDRCRFKLGALFQTVRPYCVRLVGLGAARATTSGFEYFISLSGEWRREHLHWFKMSPPFLQLLIGFVRAGGRVREHAVRCQLGPFTPTLDRLGSFRQTLNFWFHVFHRIHLLPCRDRLPHQGKALTAFLSAQSPLPDLLV